MVRDDGLSEKKRMVKNKKEKVRVKLRLEMKLNKIKVG